MKLLVLAAPTVAFLSTPAHAQSEAQRGPTYALDLSRDIPALVLASAAAVTPILQRETPPAWCAPLCDASRVNAFDRPTAAVYRPAWARVTDVTVATLVVTPIVVMAADEGVANMLSDLVVVAETQLIASGFASLTSAAVRRPRPYMYSEAAPLADRQQADGAFSFFSGHTTNAFAASLVLYSTLKRRHPDSPAANIALSGTLAAASLVGTGRILAGKHFPTDVFAGALVGSSMGILVPALHASGLSVSPAPVGGSPGLSVSGFW